MNVVQMREATLLDVPAQLRRLADAIDRGDHGTVDAVALVLSNGDYTAFSWGECTASQAHVLFAIGMRKVEEAYREG